MPLLLEIPREIRDLIYVEVLHVSNPRPPYPRDPDDACRPQTFNFDPQFFTSSCKCYLEDFVATSSTFTMNQSAGLLYSNRQVNAEVTQVIERIRTKQVDYVVDCMIIRKDILFTWISIPVPTTRISTLHVDVRPHGDYAMNMTGRYLLAPSLNNSLRQDLYRLLVGLLIHTYQPIPAVWNSSTGAWDEETHCKIDIKRLVLKIGIPDVSDTPSDPQEQYKIANLLVHLIEELKTNSIFRVAVGVVVVQLDDEANVGSDTIWNNDPES